jgi:hypothetical protein
LHGCKGGNQRQTRLQCIRGRCVLLSRRTSNDGDCISDTVRGQEVPECRYSLPAAMTQVKHCADRAIEHCSEAGIYDMLLPLQWVVAMHSSKRASVAACVGAVAHQC